MQISSKEKPLARILVIDDEQDTAQVIRRMLNSENILADAFSSPAAALEHWKQHSTEYCFVLSDIRMPGVSGFEVARQVRHVNPDVKIVLTSSFEIHMSEFDKVMPKTQVDDFILKPVGTKELMRTIYKHIGDSKILPPEAWD